MTLAIVNNEMKATVPNRRGFDESESFLEGAFTLLNGSTGRPTTLSYRTQLLARRLNNIGGGANDVIVGIKVNAVSKLRESCG